MSLIMINRKLAFLFKFKFKKSLERKENNKPFMMLMISLKRLRFHRLTRGEREKKNRKWKMMALECGRHDDGMNGGFIV